jgi:hypothetical protein
MSHTATLIVVIVATVLWGVAFSLSLLMAAMSPMMFDAPGSEKKNSLRVAFFVVLALPVLLIISVVGAWIAISRTHDVAALWFCAAPLLVVVPGLFVLTR